MVLKILSFSEQPRANTCIQLMYIIYPQRVVPMIQADCLRKKSIRKDTYEDAYRLRHIVDQTHPLEEEYEIMFCKSSLK